MLLLAGGVGLHARALDASLLSDDWDHYAMAQGVYPVARSPFDLFNFVAGNADERAALLESGRLPWWISADLKLAVFRPLASVLTYWCVRSLDAQHGPFWLHLHSLLWWVVLLLAVARLYSALLPPMAAGIALLIYTVDEAHALPVAWGANSSELVANALMAWALVAHVAARERRTAWAGPMSWLLVLLGLAAGEHAFSLLGYFVSYALLGSSEPLRQRLRAVLPTLSLALGFLAVRQALGYGVAGSSYYVDPVAEPLRYAAACLWRAPLLLGDLLFGFVAESWYWQPPWRQSLLTQRWAPAEWLTLGRLRELQHLLGLLAVVIALAATIGLVRVTRRRLAPVPTRLAWLLSGALLGLLPLCATLPMTRLTSSAAIGVDAALGCLLAWAIAHVSPLRAAGRMQRMAALACALVVFGIHVAYPAVRNYDITVYYDALSHLEENWAARAALENRGLAQRHVFIVAARDWASQYALPYVRRLHGLEVPASCDLLSIASGSPHELVRIAPNAFDLVVARPHGETTYANSVYRPEGANFSLGDRVDAARFSVEILALNAGQPSHLRFVFHADLDNARYVFVYPKASGIASITLPRVGERLALGPPAWPRKR